MVSIASAARILSLVMRVTHLEPIVNALVKKLGIGSMVVDYPFATTYEIRFTAPSLYI
jgi:hypothetical protein